MSTKLPCEIIKDLLPTYIDGLESDVTKEAVEEHLRECKECSVLCENMKKEYVQETAIEPEEEAKTDRVMLHKIKKKLNRKVRIAIEVGIVAVLLAVGSFELLFNAVIKEVPRQEVEVTAEVYPMKEFATVDLSAEEQYGLSNDADQMVVISTGNEASDAEEQSYTISIPDFPGSHLSVTQGILDQYETLTLIKWKSPYFLRSILWEIKETDGERVMYIEHYKTTVLNNRQASGGSYTTSIDFGTLDRIVYLESDGTETVLWEQPKDSAQ